MLFRAKSVAKTWDTWAFYHQGVYYLFYLISGMYPGEGFGVATSRDGVLWEDHGPVLTHSEQMVRYLGTGSVWKAVDFDQTGNFLSNYCEWRRHKIGEGEVEKNIQCILFAASKDLIHWQKYPEETIFHIDERYYKRIEPDAQWAWQDPRWDGISVIPKPGGGYYGFWTATPRDGLSFGFGESADGLHWQALPPPVIEWNGEPDMHFIEIGGVWQLGDQYFAMLGDYASKHCGMFTFVADAPGGPYRLAAKNFALLPNPSRMHVYFSRFFHGPDGVLVTHHALAKGNLSDPHFVVYCSPFKRAVAQGGGLYLKWWEGNEQIKGREVSLPDIASNAILYPKEQGILLEGQMHLPGSWIIATGEGGQVILSVNTQGVLEIGKADLDGSILWEERIDRQLSLGAAPSFRLLLHKTMLELYLDDYLIHCYTMLQPPAGRLVLENGTSVRFWLWREGIG